MFAYDTANRKPLHAGTRHGIHGTAAAPCSTGTSAFSFHRYGDPSGRRTVSRMHHFVSYTRRNNVFTRMNAVVPANPRPGVSIPSAQHGRQDRRRRVLVLQRERRVLQILSCRDRTELLGVNQAARAITPRTCADSKKRYITTCCIEHRPRHRHPGDPARHGDRKEEGPRSLSAFYLKKYGYHAGGPYGLEMTTRANLFFSRQRRLHRERPPIRELSRHVPPPHTRVRTGRMTVILHKKGARNGTPFLWHYVARPVIS